MLSAKGLSTYSLPSSFMLTNILLILMFSPVDMVIIERDPPPSITGFLTAPLESTQIIAAEAQFARGAFDAYDPLVKLTLDQTKYKDSGATAETIREDMDNAGQKEIPFVIFDKRTVEDGSAWWVDKWADEEITDPAELAEWLKDSVTGVPIGEGTRVLLKSRRKNVDLGTFYEAMMQGQTDILEDLPQPYNPTDPNVKAESVYDWDTDPPTPPPAQVVAGPDEFDESTDEELRKKFLIPPDKHPDKVVKLKKDVAENMKVISDWTVVRNVYDGHSYGPAPAGSIVLSQKWKVEQLVVMPGTGAGSFETA